MNKDQQREFFLEITDKMGKTMLTKGDDYANDVDRLSNFKLVADLAKVSVEKGIHIQIANKVVRLGELLSGKTPKHESVQDSIEDCANYLILLAMVISEKQPKPESKTEPALAKHIKDFLEKTNEDNLCININ